MPRSTPGKCLEIEAGPSKSLREPRITSLKLPPDRDCVPAVANAVGDVRAKNSAGTRNSQAHARADIDLGRRADARHAPRCARDIDESRETHAYQHWLVEPALCFNRAVRERSTKHRGGSDRDDAIIQ